MNMTSAEKRAREKTREDIRGERGVQRHHRALVENWLRAFRLGEEEEARRSIGS